MFGLNANLRIIVATQPTDLRKSFDGLGAFVTGSMCEKLERGSLYVFANRRRNRIKTLYFDGTGLWVASKRLEKGTFSWPKTTDKKQQKMLLAYEALQLLLDGVDLRGANLRAWYERD